VGLERSAQGTHESEYEGHCSLGSLPADPSSTLTIEFWQTTVLLEIQIATSGGAKEVPSSLVRWLVLPAASTNAIAPSAIVMLLILLDRPCRDALSSRVNQ
jgi:hypothetical protein